MAKLFHHGMLSVIDAEIVRPNFDPTGRTYFVFTRWTTSWLRDYYLSPTASSAADDLQARRARNQRAEEHFSLFVEYNLWKHTRSFMQDNHLPSLSINDLSDCYLVRFDDDHSVEVLAVTGIAELMAGSDYASIESPFFALKKVLSMYKEGPPHVLIRLVPLKVRQLSHDAYAIYLADLRQPQLSPDSGFQPIFPEPSTLPLVAPKPLLPRANLPLAPLRDRFVLPVQPHSRSWPNHPRTLNELITAEEEDPIEEFTQGPEPEAKRSRHEEKHAARPPAFKRKQRREKPAPPVVFVPDSPPPSPHDEFDVVNLGSSDDEVIKSSEEEMDDTPTPPVFDKTPESSQDL